MCQGINGTVETTSPPATNPPIGNNSNGLRRPNEPRLSNKAPQLPNGLDSTCRRSEQRDWELTPTTTTSHAANICLRYFAFHHTFFTTFFTTHADITPTLLRSDAYSSLLQCIAVPSRVGLSVCPSGANSPLQYSGSFPHRWGYQKCDNQHGVSMWC